MSENFQRATDVLGFEPTKRVATSAYILTKVKEKLQEERQKQAEEQAEKAMRQVIELCEKHAQAVRQFHSQEKKWDKELGKLLNQLEGHPPEQQPAADKQEQTTE